MSHTFKSEHDRILIVDAINENRARREGVRLYIAITALGLLFLVGFLARLG